MMKQSKLDSFMEAIVNVIVGLIVSTIASHFLLPAVLGVSMSFGQNILIGVAFTIISIVRSYALRRLFNGRSIWTTIVGFHRLPARRPYWQIPMVLPLFLLYLPAEKFVRWAGWRP